MSNPVDLGPSDYYELLKVDRLAEPDAIRRAYRKEALRYHPDKNLNNPVAAERFQRIARAYETLADPKKRKIYDQYGEQGVSMMDQMPFLDPDVLLRLNQLIGVAVVICILLLLFPILISLRADNKISWSWSIVFIPIFIIIGLLFLITLYSAIVGENEDDDLESNGRYSSGEKATVFARIFSVVYISLFLVFNILLALRLDLVIATWSTAFAPWFAMEVMHFFGIVQSLYERYKEGVYAPAAGLDENNNNQEDESVPRVARPLSFGEKVSEAFAQLIPFVFRLLQVTLIVIKLDNPNFASWGAVFTPIFVEGGYYLLTFVLTYFAMRRAGVPASEAWTSVLATIIITAVILGLLYTMVGLLIARLNSGTGSPSAAVILIPVYILTSLLLCCVGVCMPCMLSVSRERFEEGLRQQQQQQQQQSQQQQSHQSEGGGVTSTTSSSSSSSSSTSSSSINSSTPLIARGD